EGAAIAARPMDQQPYWHLEHARIGKTRKVKVELIVNGVPVASKEIIADGQWNDVDFKWTADQSSWLALRIYASAHTNPVFVEVDGKPIRVLKSLQWCRAAVDQCWKTKVVNIRQDEREAAKEAYDAARAVYDLRIKEALDR
ncbi:MAG TPA: hypothetical protein VFI14_00200, partial [Chryseosolibacter sp.]|nr:hypothetical protein [Chryseosolibacter sp.]